MATIDYLFRSQLNEYRPCYVDGEKALFHRWKEVDQLYVKANVQMQLDKLEMVKKIFIDDTHAVPSSFDTFVIKNVLAIVEFEDGTISEVESKDIQFIDGAEKFNEIAWDREMESNE